MFSYPLLYISLAGTVQVIHDLFKTFQGIPHLILLPLRDHCSAQGLNIYAYKDSVHLKSFILDKQEQNMFELISPRSYQQSPSERLYSGRSEPSLSLPWHLDPASGHQLSSVPSNGNKELNYSASLTFHPQITCPKNILL